jgi:hypothetical protein
VYKNYQELLTFKYYKYECCTITGIWKQGSAYFVVKPIKYGLKKLNVKDKTSESPLFESM